MKQGTKTEYTPLETARLVSPLRGDSEVPAPSTGPSASQPPGSQRPDRALARAAQEVSSLDPESTGGTQAVSPCPEKDRTRIAAEVLGSAEPVLLAFRTVWSRPCEVLEGVLREVEAVCGSQVKVFRLNADDHPELSLWYDIHSIPTLLCFVSGRLRFTIVGTVSKETLLAKLAALGNADHPDSL